MNDPTSPTLFYMVCCNFMRIVINALYILLLDSADKKVRDTVLEQISMFDDMLSGYVADIPTNA